MPIRKARERNYGTRAIRGLGSVRLILVWYEGNVSPVADTTSWLVECSSDDRDQKQVSKSTIVRRHVMRARPANLPDVVCIISSHDRASSEPDEWHILRSGERISLKIIMSEVLD